VALAFLPFVALAVMVTLPEETACTLPFSSTVAILVLLLDQVMVFAEALMGAIVVMSAKSGSPTFKASFVLFNVIRVTGWMTVISAIAVIAPSTVVAVMVAVPAALPVTTPFALTMAIELLDDDQVIPLLEALVG
jgi:hypothetical protein